MGKYAGRIATIAGSSLGPWMRVDLTSGEHFYMHEHEVALLRELPSGVRETPLIFFTSRVMDKVEWWGDVNEFAAAQRMGTITPDGDYTGRYPDLPPETQEYLEVVETLDSAGWVKMVQTFLADKPPSSVQHDLIAAHATALRGLADAEKARVEYATKRVTRAIALAIPKPEDEDQSFNLLRNVSDVVALGGLYETMLPSAVPDTLRPYLGDAILSMRSSAKRPGAT